MRWFLATAGLWIALAFLVGMWAIFAVLAVAMSFVSNLIHTGIDAVKRSIDRLDELNTNAGPK